jgi:hypothetical protein
VASAAAFYRHLNLLFWTIPYLPADGTTQFQSEFHYLEQLPPLPNCWIPKNFTSHSHFADLT